MAEKQEGIGTPLVMGVSGGAVAALLFKWLQGRGVQAEEGVVHLDEETMQILAAIALTEQSILTAVQSLQLGAGTVVPNTNGITSFRLVCAAATTAYHLPDVPVTDDMVLQLKGHPNNVGFIYVAGQAFEVTNVEMAWPILANEAIGYKVNNANCVWVSANVAGDIVVCTVELRK